MAIALDDIKYCTPMNYNLTKIGKAHIFINPGALNNDKDVNFTKNADILKNCLKNFNFDANVHENKNKNEIINILREAVASSESISCLFIVIMTLTYCEKETDNGQIIWADDEKYHIKELLKIFSANEDIPKLLFIQDINNDNTNLDRWSSISATTKYDINSLNIKENENFDFLLVRWSTAVLDDYFENLSKYFNDYASEHHIEDILNILEKNYPKIQILNKLIKNVYFKETKNLVTDKKFENIQKIHFTDRPDIDIYPMDKMGKAYIFNHFKFPDLKPREGSSEDTKKLTECLTKFNFDVKVYEDLTTTQIKSTMDEIEKDNSDSSSLIIIIMSHGRMKKMEIELDGKLESKDLNDLSGLLQSKDSEVKYEITFNRLNLSDTNCKFECPTPIDLTGNLKGIVPGQSEIFTYDLPFDLAMVTDREFNNLKGKPKLIFVQACRIISNITTDSDENDNLNSETCDEFKVVLPRKADTLIMHSCSDAQVSYRNTIEGTWFIQSLCNTINEYGTKLELLHLLTKVTATVVDKNNKKCVQLPQITSMLRKGFYFKETDSK